MKIPSLTTLAAAGALIALTATGLALVPVGNAQEKTADKAAGKPSLTVSFINPQRTEMPFVVQATGNIAAWQEASIGAEAGGLRVAEVRVNVGDVVHKGQVLATLSAETIEADLAQARANLAAAQSMLRVGLGSALELEEARRPSLVADAALAALAQERLAAWIALYRAVGGGWEPDAPIASR